MYTSVAYKASLAEYARRHRGPLDMRCSPREYHYSVGGHDAVQFVLIHQILMCVFIAQAVLHAGSSDEAAILLSLAILHELMATT